MVEKMGAGHLDRGSSLPGHTPVFGGHSEISELTIVFFMILHKDCVTDLGGGCKLLMNLAVVELQTAADSTISRPFGFMT
jgi:hypothetical protein